MRPYFYSGLKLIHYISTIHQEIDPTRAKPPLPISLANILNFKYGMSSNSVIPAPRLREERLRQESIVKLGRP